jgi:tRNA isopentenyl-2-thiomethyl-A-37 hydroxylase MiaE
MRSCATPRRAISNFTCGWPNAHGLDDWRERLVQLAGVEAALATAPDPEFRFHSGPPELQ